MALVGTTVVAALLTFHAVALTRRAHGRQEPLRSWMTVPYIAHSKHVPQEVLWDALGLPPHLHDRRPIGRIAREQRRSLDAVVSKLQEAIAHTPSARRAPNPPGKAEH